MIAAGENVADDAGDGAPGRLVGFEYDVDGSARLDGGCLWYCGMPAWCWSLAIHFLCTWRGPIVTWCNRELVSRVLVEEGRVPRSVLGEKLAVR